MLRNYLKIAGRNLLRNKIYSAVNIGGLTISVALATLIGLWINDDPVESLLSKWRPTSRQNC